MKVELKGIMPNSQLLCEEAARECYDSLDKMPEGGSKLIKGCVKKGHETIVGPGYATFRISEVSRSLSHQLVRHRMATYNQRSQRFVKEGQFGFVVPISANSAIEEMEFEKDMTIIQAMYDKYVNEFNWPKEDARYVLPNACHTSLFMSMTFQGYLSFFRLRLDKHAQWEIRKMAAKMWNLIQPHAPLVFNQECVERAPKYDINWSELK